MPWWRKLYRELDGYLKSVSDLLDQNQRKEVSEIKNLEKYPRPAEITMDEDLVGVTRQYLKGKITVETYMALRDQMTRPFAHDVVVIDQYGEDVSSGAEARREVSSEADQVVVYQATDKMPASQEESQLSEKASPL